MNIQEFKEKLPSGVNLHPILFSSDMVQAILEGSKTQTRRVVKPQPYVKEHETVCEVAKGEWWVGQLHNFPNVTHFSGHSSTRFYCPYGKPGDVLWVREKCCYVLLDHAHDLLEGSKDKNQWVYKNTFHNDWMEYAKETYGYKWKPSIHMPFEAARIFLRIKSVRVERLQDISEQDATSEGVDNWTWKNMAAPQNWMDYTDPKGPPICSAYDSFNSLWDSINGPESWDQNPWVWVIEFERITKEECFNS